MERWEIKHRTFVVERYVATKSVTQTQRDFRKQFGFKEAPFRNTILHYFESFKNYETVADKKYSHRVRPIRTDENINRVRDSLQNSPRKSMRRLSQQLVFWFHLLNCLNLIGK